MIYRFMLYGVFNGKHVNLFRDGRTFKNESYAKRIQREQSEYFTDKILIKKVRVKICPYCNNQKDTR